MKNDSFRLSMPITDIDQFLAVSYLDEALADLVKRTAWFISTRNAAELSERYEDLAVYLWLDHTEIPDEYNAHMELADSEYALKHYPADAVKFPFPGNWRLGDIVPEMRKDLWLAQFMVSGVQRFLELSARGSAH